MSRVAVLISDLFSGGGLEKDSWYCALAFAKAGKKVDLLTSGPAVKPAQYPSHKNITIYSLCKKPHLSLTHKKRFDKAAERFLKTHDYSIVFGLDQNTHLTHFRAGNGSHPFCLKHRALYENALKRLSFKLNPLHKTLIRFEQKLIQNPSLKKIFTNSHFIKRAFCEQYNLPSDFVDVIYNGVEFTAFEPHFKSWEKKRASLLKQRKLSPKNFQFVFVGSGFARKGLSALIKAFAHLKNEPVELSVIGKDKHLKRYKALAEKLGIASQIHFFGKRDDAHTFYQLADSCVIPSYYDPCANVTLEALAMGLYVVSSKTNGGFELLSKETGCVIDDLLDPLSCLKALRTALEHPKTAKSAKKIRTSVKEYEFEKQFLPMIKTCLAT